MTTTPRTKTGKTSLPNRLPQARTKKQSEANTSRSPGRTIKIDWEQPVIQQVIKHLSSPYLSSPRTIGDIVSTSNQFLTWLRGRIPPSEDDYRDFISYLRNKKLSEYTLGKKFSHLHTLAIANKWLWTFDRHSRPKSKKPKFSPAYKIAEIAQMILNRDKLTPKEQLYLAIVTTWGSRREEVAAFQSRDLKDGIITIHIIKEDTDVEHILPPVFKPIFSAVKIKPITPSAMTGVFHRICLKTGVHREKGWGWHSIRRQIMYPLEAALAEHRLPQSWAGTYMAWTKAEIGNRYHGTPMAGTYSHGNEATEDPFEMERKIIAIHPYLKFWSQKPPGQVSKKNVKSPV